MAVLRAMTGERRRGNAFVEFALVFLLMLTLLVGAFEFTWVLFVRATFHHAVREAVRAAITANPPSAYSGQFDNYLKEVIHHNTLGLLSGPDLDAHVDVQFFDPNCAGHGLSGRAPRQRGAWCRFRFAALRSIRFRR